MQKTFRAPVVPQTTGQARPAGRLSGKEEGTQIGRAADRAYQQPGPSGTQSRPIKSLQAGMEIVICQHNRDISFVAGADVPLRQDRLE